MEAPLADIFARVRAGLSLNPVDAQRLFDAYEVEVKARQIADQEATYKSKLWQEARTGLLPGILSGATQKALAAEQQARDDAEQEIIRLRNVLVDVSNYITGHVQNGTRGWRRVADEVWGAIETALEGLPVVLNPPAPTRSYSDDRGPVIYITPEGE